MICECGGATRVLDSRPSNGHIRRRRQCENCAKRFTTYETRQQRGAASKDENKEALRREVHEAMHHLSLAVWLSKQD